MVQKKNVSFEGVLNDIKSGKTVPVYIFYGSDEFLVTEASNKIVAGLCAGDEGLFGREVLDGKTVTVKECAVALLTLPFLAKRKVVYIRDCRFLSNPTKGDENALNDIIKTGIPEASSLVLTNTKITEKTVLCSFALAHGVIMEFSGFEKEDARTLDEIYAIASKRLEQSGKSIRKTDFSHLVSYTGLSLRQIADELEKLVVYSGKTKKEITRQDIDLLIPKSREAKAYKLADTVGDRDLNTALELVSDLLVQGESPISVLITIENRIRLLTQLAVLNLHLPDKDVFSMQYYDPNRILAWINGLPKELADRLGDEKNQNILKQHPYRIFIMIRQSRFFSLEELIDIYRKMVDTNTELVNSSKDQKVLLELLILSICRDKNNQPKVNHSVKDAINR